MRKDADGSGWSQIRETGKHRSTAGYTDEQSRYRHSTGLFVTWVSAQALAVVDGDADSIRSQFFQSLVFMLAFVPLGDSSRKTA